MNVLHSALRAAVVAVVAAGTVSLVGVSPAAALPYGCTGGSEGSYRWVYCSAGTGGYQIVMQCDAPYAFDYTREGPVQTVGSGLQSRARCSLGHRPYNEVLKRYESA